MSPGSSETPANSTARVEVVDGDRVVVVEVVDALDPGNVEQHPSGGHRSEVLDAEIARTRLGDHVSGDAVVELAAVAHVGERIPVGGGLGAHAHPLVAGGEAVGVAGVLDVHGDHLERRVVAPRNAAGLGPIGIERDGQREGAPLANRRRAPLDGGRVDQVERAPSVVAPPPASVGHPGGEFEQGLRELGHDRAKG